MRSTVAAALMVTGALVAVPSAVANPAPVDLVQMRARTKAVAEQEAAATATAAAALVAAQAAAQAAALAAAQATQAAEAARAAQATQAAEAARAAQVQQTAKAATAKPAVPPEATAFAGETGAASSGKPDGAAAPKGPTLAAAFGATAIRETGSGRIEIHFGQEPRNMKVFDGSGKVLEAAWNGTEKVLSLPTVDRFTVSGDGKAVEVMRAPGIAYEYPDENRAGLVRVFEYNDATYLSFAKPKASITVYDENHQGTGRHRDQYYKFDGIAKRLTVVADGEVIYVDRVPEVRFFQRAKEGA
ncbi:hypothetical protein [Cupriavidus basilensis]|uniref:hypothetical protein n=1 Tax=Cupriavidus basilensis TaxID=68895 RepID=UPI0023E7AEB3|nr:hypothetical protein [Cupriavidus basilensis]MDF3883119.1 hypothetical protein [Cupriavidus basilensis]